MDARLWWWRRAPWAHRRLRAGACPRTEESCAQGATALARLLSRAVALTALLVTASALPAGASAPATLTAPAALLHPNASAIPSYRIVSAIGEVQAFGGALSAGNLNQPLNAPIVGSAATPDNSGYWLIGSDGGVFAFGGAAFAGSTGGMTLRAPVVGVAPGHDDNGYWLVASDGGIFAFGDAGFRGSAASLPLNKPIVGMARTPDGNGYWLVASDGGIFSYGDARFYGSTGAIQLAQPIVGMASTPDGMGYWLVAADGGIFAFGDATFQGSAGGLALTTRVVGMAATPDGRGYWLLGQNGTVLNYGSAGYYGYGTTTAAAVSIEEAPGNGSQPAYAPYPHGSYGYDVSNFQCTALPGPPHPVAIVESSGAVGNINPCLAAEADWAGAGLNLYIFLNDIGYGSGTPLCSDASSCYALGASDAVSVLGSVRSAGVNSSVTWWLDVEGAGTYWQSNTALNVATLQGAVDGLRGQGVREVGVYVSPLGWAPIMGTYQPQLPLWLAWYTGNPSANCQNGYSYASANGNDLPSGGIVVTQYTDNNGTLDGDFAC